MKKKYINVKSDGFWKDSSESFIFNNTVIYYVSKSMLCLLSRFFIICRENRYTAYFQVILWRITEVYILTEFIEFSFFNSDFISFILYYLCQSLYYAMS